MLQEFGRGHGVAVIRTVRPEIRAEHLPPAQPLEDAVVAGAIPHPPLEPAEIDAVEIGAVEVSEELRLGPTLGDVLPRLLGVY